MRVCADAPLTLCFWQRLNHELVSSWGLENFTEVKCVQFPIANYKT